MAETHRHNWEILSAGINNYRVCKCGASAYFTDKQMNQENWMMVGDALAGDLETALEFIAEEFQGNLPDWFDQFYKDLDEWRKTTTQG